MLKAVHCAGIALMLGIVLSGAQPALAQIAPINSATISGSVNDSTGKPVANAKVSLNGPKATSMETDAHGLFVFVGMPLGNYQITAETSNLGTATRNITVDGDTNVAIVYNAAIVNGMKIIAQVGTTATAQFNITSASITQVNPMSKAFQGETSWRKILEQIPGVAQAGLVNGTATLASLPDSPFVPMQISIDGTLPYETAILFDDMPLIGTSYSSHAGTGTNIGLYPLNGFSAADVVRGPGASAPSIVNSIGGSFVLHPPGVVFQNHYELSASTDPYGGIIVNTLAAVHYGKLSALVTYGVTNSPGPLASAGTSGSYLFLFGPISVNGNSLVAYSPPCSAPCSGGILLAPNYSDNGFRQYGYQRGLLVSADNFNSGWSTHSGSLALDYALSPTATAGLFYSGSTAIQRSTPSYTEVNFVPPSGYSGGIASGSYTFGQGILNNESPYYQASSLLEEKVTAQLGKGVLRLAALQNRTYDSCGYSNPGSANVRLYGGGYLNGSSSLTFFNGDVYNVGLIPINLVRNGETDNRDFLGNYTTQIAEKYHAGISYVKSYYNNPASLSYAFGPPFNFASATSVPSAISETTGEFRIFAGGNLSEKTSLDLSMYFANANYHVPDPNNQTINTSNYGNATYVDARYTYAAPRLGFVWRPTAVVAIRAAAGGGFALSPLGNLVGSNDTPDCSGGPFCTVSITNFNIQPEKSFSFDLGTDIRLHHNTVVSFDVYRSNLYGQFYSSTSLTGTYLGLPLYTTQNGNLGVSRFEGVLLDLRHNVPHGPYWSLSGGLTRGYVVSVPAGFYDDASGPCDRSTATTPDGNPCPNLTVVPNINFNGTFVATIPYAQGLGTLGYRWNPDKYADLVATYYGNNNTYLRPAFVEIDAHFGYPVTKNASMLLTFRNITGIYGSAIQYQTLENITGAPTIAGPPCAMFGEMFGPRTAQLTVSVH